MVSYGRWHPTKLSDVENLADPMVLSTSCLLTNSEHSQLRKTVAICNAKEMCGSPGHTVAQHYNLKLKAAMYVFTSLLMCFLSCAQGRSLYYQKKNVPIYTSTSQKCFYTKLVNDFLTLDNADEEESWEQPEKETHKGVLLLRRKLAELFRNNALRYILLEIMNFV